MKRWFTALLLALATTVGAQDFTPVEGNYWNKGEPGTAYQISVHNGTMVTTIYSYTPSGLAQWYLVVCQIQADATCTGTLDKYRDGQSIGGSYVAPIQKGNDGVATFEWLSESRLRLTLPQQRVVDEIVPFEFNTFFGPKQIIGKWVFIAFNQLGSTVSTPVLDFTEVDDDTAYDPVRNASCQAFPGQVFRCVIKDGKGQPIAVWTVKLTVNAARGSTGNTLDGDVVVQGYRLDPQVNRVIPD